MSKEEHLLIFKNNTFEMLCLQAEASYPKECCGILLGQQENEQRIVHRIASVENTAVEELSVAHFRIDPLAIYRVETTAEQDGLEIVGFYHSHPDCSAVPSKEDIQHMIVGFSYPILSLQNGACVTVRSFEKILQTDTQIQEEILIKEH